MLRQRFRANGGLENGLLGIDFGAIRSRCSDGPVGVGTGRLFVLGSGGGSLGQFGQRSFFLQDGVGLEFGLEKVLQFQGRGLEKLQGLLNLGGNRGGLP